MQLVDKGLTLLRSYFMAVADEWPQDLVTRDGLPILPES
jgi:hypothetical protein